MAEPTQKSPEIDEFLKDGLGFDRKGSIESDKCVFCGKPATEFRDELSRKEYYISGICQECQDKTFGKD
jgi:hypothetical protein